MSQSAPLTLHEHAPASVKAKAYINHDLLMDCIHCGLCLSQCPTYAEEGLEADSPRGRIYLIRALAEGRAEATPSLVSHLDLCLGCRGCETACPSGVQYGHILEGAREHLRKTYKRPWKQRYLGKAVEASFPHPNRMEAALLPVRVLRRTGVLPLLRRIGFMKLLGYLGDMETMLPPLPPMTKRLRFPTTIRARGSEQARVGMITGCVMQVMQSPVNESTARVLARAGCRVEAPKKQACCGALHAHIGGMDEARAFAKKNIIAFEELEAGGEKLDAIVINAAGCGASLKEYGSWFHGDAEWEPRAKRFAEKVRDISEWLAQPQYKSRLEALMQTPQNASASGASTRVANSDIEKQNMNDVARETVPNVEGASSLQGAGIGVARAADNRAEAQDAVEATAPENSDAKVPMKKTRMTYHDACHLAHGQGIRVQPRELMNAVPGAEFVPLAESELCCGSAGVYNITQPQMAMQLLERKMKHIAATGAGVVVTGNPGCMMQIMMGAKKFDVPVEIKHPIEILDAATRGAAPKSVS